MSNFRMYHNYSLYKRPKCDIGPLEVTYRVLVDTVDHNSVVSKKLFDTFDGQKILDYGK